MFNLLEFRLLHMCNIYDRLIKEGDNKGAIQWLNNEINTTYQQYLSHCFALSVAPKLQHVRKVRRALSVQTESR